MPHVVVSGRQMSRDVDISKLCWGAVSGAEARVGQWVPWLRGIAEQRTSRFFELKPLIVTTV